ncbi:MAG: DUF4926 domain-containing protein [Bacteroidota bacterium]
MKEYDIVRLNKQIQDVLEDSIGTILLVYEDNKSCEVEFVNDAGETINILTVKFNDLY